MKKLGKKVGENRGKFYLSPAVCQRVCRLFFRRSQILTSVCQHEFAKFIGLPCEGRLTLFTCTGSRARVNDAKIVRSRDTQCNTEESP